MQFIKHDVAQILKEAAWRRAQQSAAPVARAWSGGCRAAPASAAGACRAGVSPVRVSIVTGSPISSDRLAEIALDVDGERLERRDVERVDAAIGLARLALGPVGQLVRLGRKPASVLPAPVGAISSTDFPACAFASRST